MPPAELPVVVAVPAADHGRDRDAVRGALEGRQPEVIRAI